MRRITFWLLSTLTVVVLLFGYDASNATGPTAASPPAAVSGTGGGVGSSGTTADSGAGSAASSGKAGKTVTGSVASTQWGPVQVQLSISGGKVTGVAVLQHPSGNPKDDEINSYALPILNQETVKDQSANIDMVSGATVTSTGYIQSLQSALDQAGL
jgi:uncharacterized protein with FMN-binding domain